MMLTVSRGFAGVLVCHGIVRFQGFWSLMILSASRGFGLLRCCPFLRILVCHGVVRFKGFSGCHSVVRF